MATLRIRLPSFQGLLVLLAGEGLTRLLSFFAVTQLTRRLGDRGWAPVEVALAALQFAALGVEMGFPLLCAREVARDRGAVDRLLPRVVPTQLLAAAALFLAALVADRARLVAPDLGELLPGYAASLFLLPLALPWVFQGRGEMHWVALPQVVRQAVFLVVSVAIVSGVAERARLPWAEAAAVGSAAAVALVAFRRRGRLRLVPRQVVDLHLLREALPIGGSQFLWALRMYLPTLFLWQLVERESVARYGVAHKVMMVLQALLTMYFTNLFPALSRAVHGPRPQLRRLLLQSVAIAAGGMLFLAVAIGARARPLLATCFGPAFHHEEAAECLALLAFVLPVLACRGHARMTLLAMGRSRAELYCSAGGTALLALLVPWLASARGASGAALALLASELAASLATALALRAALRSGSLPRLSEPPEAAP
jgi:O-antigen/teichoic acid export membrane protein